MTILVISYNYARFLRAAVDSALGQGYPRVDVLVVDDGSTDDSLAVLAGYGDAITVSSGRNGGQAAAVNRGLRLAQGDVLMFLDADDVLLPDVVERVVDEFVADPACVRVQFRLLECDEDGRPTGGTVPPRTWPLLQGDLTGHVTRYRMFRSPPTSGNAWQMSALRDIPPVPEITFRQYIDRWYSELTALVGTVRALDEPGGRYRLHAASHHVGVGKGLEYFATRIALTRELHAAGAQVAANAGVQGYPKNVDDPLDAAFLSWRVLERKLGPGSGVDGEILGLAARASYAAWRQPAQPWRSRAGRAAWILAVAVLPRRGRILHRLIDSRYDRGTH